LCRKEEKVKYDKQVTRAVKQIAQDRGADLVGIASVERFKEAPEGHRPTDILPEAKSVIVVGRRILDSVMEQLDNPSMRMTWHHHMYAHLNALNSVLCYEIAALLEQKGYWAIPVQPTTPYYKDKFFGVSSHRHAAVAAGLGVFGMSNLVLTPQFGPRVRWDQVITSAYLAPNPLLEENLCRECFTCRQSCPVQAWDVEGNFNKAVCAFYMKWDRKTQVCYEPCGLCIKVCPVGRDRVDLQ
jgi:epoxyqueuosine reductase